MTNSSAPVPKPRSTSHAAGTSQPRAGGPSSQPQQWTSQENRSILTARGARQIAAVAAVLAGLSWLCLVPIGLSGPLRQVLGFVFVVAVPGVCLLLAGGVRHVPTLAVLGCALSLSLGTLLSLGLMLAGVWSVGAAVTLLAAVSVAAAAVVRRGIPEIPGDAGNRLEEATRP